MKNYVLNYADGSTSDIWAESEEKAIATACDLLQPRHGEVIAADDWDADGLDDDGRPMVRLLFWESDEAAHNDAGQRSIAQLSTTEDA